MKKNENNINLKIPKQIHEQMLLDLRKPHAFAYERVGFLFTKSKLLSDKTLIIIATEYVPVDDIHYLEDSNVGAKINSTAIRNAMQGILERKGGCFHVHLHDHIGVPSPSSTDEKSLPGLVESFANISGDQINGILILSANSLYVTVKTPSKRNYVNPNSVSVIGYPMLFIQPSSKEHYNNKIFDRQSFLGVNSQYLLKTVKVGIVGYGGGGSHIGQQLAHLGVNNIFIFDNDKVEDTNLNRLVGAWFHDVKKALLKTSIAKRVIKKISPTAKVYCINSKWQEHSESIQKCDIVFGCVDSYSEREQLEAECRRYLIPYIDIGMDVHKVDNEPYSMSGQVILSMPGSACMTCMGFLSEKKLAIEAAKYGKIGGRPQVIWPNGVLASTAVGVFIDLLTGWTGQKNKTTYLSYDGTLGILSNHVRLNFINEKCVHYNLNNTGAPNFKPL